ncbi:hypothetical protein V7S43_017484 [Phytophthora oleae]|uniref:RxLR effector protein n=1 Tax=Phytophthora oleae TaxID=2107226 RepID=A0ABD3EVG7_9STRA
MVVAIANGMTVTGANETVTIKNITPASDASLLVPDCKIRRLRRNEKLSDEERAVAIAGPAWYATHVMSRPSTSTQASHQILNAVENNKPLPKWAKAFIILAGLGVVAGTTAFYVKVMQALSSTSKSGAN